MLMVDGSLALGKVPVEIFAALMPVRLAPDPIKVEEVIPAEDDIDPKVKMLPVNR